MRQYKREATSVSAIGGLPTPADSYRSSPSATPALKREATDSIDLTSSDTVEVHDLYNDDSGGQEQHSAVPIRSSRPPSVPPLNLPTLNMAPALAPAPAPLSDGLALVGRDVKRLIDTIDQLKQIGLKSVEAELPELVLVGDQSAGKSSLMGAIAEIRLPKGQSMCTKCPTNIRTSSSDVWSCTVSLDLSYRYEANRRQSGEFPNWTEREDPVRVSFKTTYDKAELEEILKWAQIALLNPTESLDSFIPGSIDQLRRGARPDLAQFSPNVIVVEIAGPGLPNLSFYDLPGLFQVAEATDKQYLVKVFEKLTKKYIRHPNALIICTISMQNDPGLSRTKAVISDMKAESRCIGVLTMPDRLQQAHADYDKIFRGQGFRLGLGYFVTKQPGSNSRLGGPDYHALARREEEEFFRTDPTWADGGDWAQFRHMCGTEVIQSFLSKQFATFILNSLPDLTNNILGQARDVDEQLAKLPEIAQNRVQEIVRRQVAGFASQSQLMLDGSSGSSTFYSQYNSLCEFFLKAVESMRPGCKVSTRLDGGPEVINLDDDSDLESLASSSMIGSKRSFNDFTPTPKRQRLPDGGMSSTQSSPLKNDASVSRNLFVTPTRKAPVSIDKLLRSKFRQSEFGPFYQLYLTLGNGAMSLEDIRQIIKNQAQPGKPGHVSPKVYDYFALMAIRTWDKPLETFITNTFQILRDEILLILDTVLGNFMNTNLYRKSRQIIEDFLAGEEEVQRATSIEFYDSEKTSLFTICKAEFERHKADALEQLTTIRRNTRVKAYADRHYKPPRARNDEENNNSASTKRQEWMDKITDQQLGTDPFIVEIGVASYIRGYYTTAAIRFVDTVCANMNSKYFRKVKNEISYLLESELRLDSQDSEAICQGLLEGDEHTARQRTALKKKKEKLTKFIEVLNQLKASFGGGGGGNGNGNGNGLGGLNGVNRSRSYRPFVEDESDENSSGTANYTPTSGTGMEID